MSIATNGTEWLYTLVNDQDWSSFGIATTNASFSVYIGFGLESNPNEFHHDVSYNKIKAGSKIVMTPATLGLHKDTGIVAAIKVWGYNTELDYPIENEIILTTTTPK